MICQLWENGKSCNVTPEKSEEVTSDAKAGGDASTDEQFARLVVKIYKADGISKPDSGIMAHVRKTLSVDVAELIDPYVQVSFAGLKGATSRKKHTSVPCWNEQIVFTVKFPLPLEPIVLQLRDGDTVLNNILGEIYVSLDKISNPGEKGFLPTFGPCFVYLQPPKGLFKDEAIFYCGRVLMAISTEIVYTEDFRKPQAYAEHSFPLPEVRNCNQSLK
ncbi:otoferlin-like [Stegodyphus dumicola]|uniref:otoferlin-like n=1 Tax=Stegodyphus dumicola TaxID=202533 RepID=UPI0015AC3BF9|nr:otoferlin-like [Stegodyphus dumicola]